MPNLFLGVKGVCLLMKKSVRLVSIYRNIGGSEYAEENDDNKSYGLHN